MGTPAMRDTRAFGGTERRRHHVLITRNREYHTRDGYCVAVRDRRSREFVPTHPAIGKQMTAGIRMGRDGVEEVSPPESLVAGEQLCFSSCNGDLENDVITSPLVTIERPPKDVVVRYDELRA